MKSLLTQLQSLNKRSLVLLSLNSHFVLRIRHLMSENVFPSRCYLEPLTVHSSPLKPVNLKIFPKMTNKWLHVFARQITAIHIDPR